MSRRKRLRRDDPARTAPIRRFSTLLRPNDEHGTRDSAATAGGPARSEPDPHADDAAARTVGMGYSVIEEQIRQGRLAAQRMAGFTPEFGSMTNDLGPIVNRLLRYSADLGALYFDLLGALSRPSTMNGAPFGGTGPSPAGATSNPASAHGTRVVIEIVSKRKNQVTLDLWADSDKLAITPLHAVDSDNAPLTDVTFKPAADGEPKRIQIVVPDSQPADVYSGLIMDRDTKTSKGTLSLRLYP